MAERSEFRVVGKDVPIKDAVEKVTGSLKYGVDVIVPNMVYGKILRSPHAHAKIKSIDLSKADALPGVLGIVTHHDAPDWEWNSCWYNYRGRILDDHVRFVGDEVAAVAAISEDVAEEAIGLIEVEYELLDPVFDPEVAMGEDAPQVRYDGNAREPLEFEWGDLEEGERGSDVIVESSMNFGSQQYASIGRNACVAEWEGDRLTLRTSTQTPSEAREEIAKGLGVPIANVRIIAQPSGSSFGLWWINAFHLITALLARKTKRPVKIELDQEECFATVKRRHLERSKGRLGCKQDGTITFIDVQHIHDNGGYGVKPDVGFLIVDLWGGCPHGSFAIQGVSTNLVSAGCMRGVGDVTLGAFVERLLDMAAIEIDMDPVEFRLKNHIRTGDPLRAIVKRDYAEEGNEGLPDEWPIPGYLSSGALEQCLTSGAEASGWEKRWLGWGNPCQVDGSKRRAVGMATGVHCCGTEDEYGSSALVRVHADGSATLCVSMGRQGQGSETTQAQIASEALGIPYDRIRVEAGDTEVCPPNHGSIASNTAYRTGLATWDAALDARRLILGVAAKHFQISGTDQFELQDGVITHREDKNVEITIEELMSHLEPDTMTPPVIVGRTSRRMPPSTSYVRHFSAHFVEIEVDSDTGEIKLLDYVASQDSGTVLNPKVLENQVIGGAILSSGFALSESLVFEEGTGRILNPGFLDYKVLRTTDFPTEAEVIFAEPYDPLGPFGAKSAGESPACAPIPAISQAVYNAIGVWLDVPMTPERVLEALGKIEKE
jgi:xanthine dehydrogenase molybdenum-binding subunit